MSQQVHRNLIRDDLVYERWMQIRPAGLCISEALVKVRRGWRSLPRLPNIRGEFRGRIVGEQILELLLERSKPQVL